MLWKVTQRAQLSNGLAVAPTGEWGITANTAKPWRLLHTAGLPDEFLRGLHFTCGFQDTKFFLCNLTDEGLNGGGGGSNTCHRGKQHYTTMETSNKCCTMHEGTHLTCAALRKTDFEKADMMNWIWNFRWFHCCRQVALQKIIRLGCNQHLWKWSACFSVMSVCENTTQCKLFLTRLILSESGWSRFLGNQNWQLTFFVQPWSSSPVTLLCLLSSKDFRCCANMQATSTSTKRELRPRRWLPPVRQPFIGWKTVWTPQASQGNKGTETISQTCIFYQRRKQWTSWTTQVTKKEMK